MKDIAFAGWNSFWRKMSLPFVIFTWCFGLSCGFWLTSYAEPSVVFWMKALVKGRGSILGLLTVNILPFVFSVFAIRFHASFLIVPISLLKSFLIGFCQCCVLSAFGNTGWVVAILFMFSQSITSVLLLWFWIRNINQTGQWHIKDSVVYIVSCLTFSIMDYLLVLPYLASLMV